MIATSSDCNTKLIPGYLHQFWHNTSVTVSQAELPKDIFAPGENLATIV
jgi:hypothetical protein